MKVLQRRIRKESPGWPQPLAAKALSHQPLALLQIPPPSCSVPFLAPYDSCVSIPTLTPPARYAFKRKGARSFDLAIRKVLAESCCKTWLRSEERQKAPKQ